MADFLAEHLLKSGPQSVTGVWELEGLRPVRAHLRADEGEQLMASGTLKLLPFATQASALGERLSQTDRCRRGTNSRRKTILAVWGGSSSNLAICPWPLHKRRPVRPEQAVDARREICSRLLLT
jgi:hypothetical protein